MTESETRTNNFTVGVVNSTTFKTVIVKITVTKPNEFGEFEIITQIGDETPNRRITTINNEKIVKTN